MPRGAHGEADLPSIQAQAPGRKKLGFGEIDVDPQSAPMPAPAPPPAPKRVRARTVQFGEIESEDPSVDLPQVGRSDANQFGEIDLPLVAGANVGLPAVPPGYGPGLPVPASHQPGLPVAAQAPGLPMAARGGVGLPSPAYGAGLPMTAQGVGLPSPAHGGGLPMPASGGGLPMTAQSQGYPMPAHGQGLPMPAAGGGLPLPVQGGGLPSPGGGLPMAAPGGGLPSPVHGYGLPATSQGGLPASAQAVGMPLSAQSVGVPSPRGGAGSVVGAELYGDAPPYDENAAAHLRGQGRNVPGSELDPNDPMALDRPPPPGLAGGGGGHLDFDAVGEADIAAIPIAPVDVPRPMAPGPVVALAPKKSNARKVVVAAVLIVGVAGGLLALAPDIGPFGVNFISDNVNASSHAQALTDLRKQVADNLDADTFAGAQKALTLAKTAQGSTPRYRPIVAYAAFVVQAREMRFGKKSEDDAYAKAMLAAAAGDASDSFKLANAASLALSNNADRARQIAAEVAAKGPDVDVLSLAGEIELLAKSTKEAQAAWTRAVQAHKSARTLFGLARANLAAGKMADAEKAARDAIAASPDHAGARTLLAGILWKDPSHEAEALALLKKVTDESSSVRAAASEAELIDAFTTLGKIHLGRSRISQAEAAFAAALKLDPQSVQALVGNGELFYRAGRYSEAASRFEAASRADGANVQAQIGLSKAWLALEKMKEAKDKLKSLRQANPSDPTILLWLGRTEEALGNKKDAESTYLEAIKQGGDAPEVIEAYVALAHLLSANNRVDDANKKLEEATSKFPDLPALHKAKGDVALQTGRYEDARKEFEIALTKDDDLGTRFKLGVALMNMRHFEEAASTFDKVAAIDKDFPGLALERGTLYAETGQSEKALEMYNGALEKAKDDIDLQLRVGEAQVLAGHAEQAEAMLLKVYNKGRSTSAEVNHFLGRAKLMKGSLAEAMRFLRKATDLDSNRAEYWLYVAWAANEQGDSSTAEEAVKHALDLNADLADAYWQRGMLRQKQGATDDAIRDLQTALAKRPTRFEAYATLALCYADQGRWGDVETAWTRAIAGNDQVADWHFRHGKALLDHGSKTTAAVELEKAIAIADERKQIVATLYMAHFYLGEFYHASNKEKAIAHYKVFMAQSPAENAYRADAKKALEALGVHDF